MVESGFEKGDGPGQVSIEFARALGAGELEAATGLFGEGGVELKRSAVAGVGRC